MDLPKEAHEDMKATRGDCAPSYSFLQHGEEVGCWVQTWLREMTKQRPVFSIFAECADLEFQLPQIKFWRVSSSINLLFWQASSSLLKPLQTA